MNAETAALHELDHGGRTVPNCNPCLDRSAEWRKRRDETADRNNRRAGNYTPERAAELRARRGATR